MLVSAPMEGLRQVWRVRVAFLCVLFGLWCSIPLAGADVLETCCGPGELMVGATTAAQGAADDVAMVMAAGDMLAMAVITDTGVLVMAATNSESDSIARERRRRPGSALPLPLRPIPGPRPKPSPAR
jgi:hypothetical protein